MTLHMICGVALEAATSLFFKFADEILSKPPTISPVLIENFAKDALGKNRAMTDVSNPRVIVNTAMACYSPPVLLPICNYGDARNNQKPPSEWKMWEAALATSAVPAYFLPFDGKYIDGGVMANNPTIDAMAEVHHQEEKEKSRRKLALVVSLGSGEFPQIEHDKVSFNVPNLGNLSAIDDFKDSLVAVKNLFQDFLMQLLQTGGQEVVQAEAWCGNLGIPYFRFSAQLQEVSNKLTVDKTILTGVMFEQHLHLLRNAHHVDSIARLLLSRS